MTQQCSPGSDPKILAKLLRAIAGGENAKASSHDVIFLTAADWLDRIDDAQRVPDEDHPDCTTARECELYHALIGLASYVTAKHRDYRRWKQGGVMLEPIVTKALRLDAVSLSSAERA